MVFCSSHLVQVELIADEDAKQKLISNTFERFVTEIKPPFDSDIVCIVD